MTKFITVRILGTEEGLFHGAWLPWVCVDCCSPSLGLVGGCMSGFQPCDKMPEKSNSQEGKVHVGLWFQRF